MKIVRGVMRNLKSAEALKKFRSLNRRFYEPGTKALLDNEKGCEHLRGELHVKGSLTEEQLEYLLHHGSAARRVYLDLRVVLKRSVEDIRNIIISSLKEMQVLVIQFIFFDGEDLLADPRELLQNTDSLPNLRSVYLPSSTEFFLDNLHLLLSRYIIPEFVHKLIHAAGNLKEIRKVDDVMLYFINGALKFPAVKSLTIFSPVIVLADGTVMRDSDDEEMEVFASCGPKLSELILQEFKGRDSVIIAMMKSSKETLRKIKIFPYDGNLLIDATAPSAQEFPVLLKVSSVDFVTLIKLTQFIGLRQLATSFPNLRKVKVNSWFDFTYFRDVPVTETFLTVRSLFINFDPGSESSFPVMDRLFRMFPSVKSVTINWEVFSKTWTSEANLWNCMPPEVRRIRLNNFRLDKYEYYGLDVLFTGIPKRLCKGVQKLKKDAIPFERLRTFPCISSLKSNGKF